MRRSKNFELLPYNLEIKNTLRNIRKEKKKAQKNPNTMENDKNYQDTRELRDHALPKVSGIPSMIKNLTIQANNFEIKSKTL